MGATEDWCHQTAMRKNNTNRTVYLISNKGEILLMQLDQGQFEGSLLEYG